jgi:predicted transcriptional regulator
MWQDFVTPNFIKINSDTTADLALKEIKEGKVVFVFDDSKFCGAIRRRFLLQIGTSFPKRLVKNLLMKPPRVTLDMPDDYIAQLFIDSGLHLLPVFEKDEMIGVIDRNTFMKEVVSEEIGDTGIEEVVSRNVITIKPEENLGKAVGLLKEYNIYKLPVFENQLLGVLNLSNILKYFSRAGKITVSNLRNTKVKDIMRDAVYSVKRNENLKKVIDEFCKKNISSLVVLNEKGYLYGMVTKTDILKKYLSSFTKESFNIRIASKVEGIDKERIFKKLSSLEKLLDSNSEVFIYFKKGKEKFRGAPLINCRLHLFMPGYTKNISVEGWGVDHAVELALHKIKRWVGECCP